MPKLPDEIKQRAKEIIAKVKAARKWRIREIARLDAMRADLDAECDRRITEIEGELAALRAEVAAKAVH